MKIRLAAIAKDEAAYLPEWIHWHLEQGFDDILICINNTKDNSKAIIEKIALNNFVTVQQIHADTEYGFNNQLLDKDFMQRNPLQSKVYADIYRQSEAEQFSHVLFLDIDEFLYIGNKNIHQFMREEDNADILLFNWFNLAGDKTPFACTGASLDGDPSPFTKFIIKTALSDIEFISTHNVRARLANKILFARGANHNDENYIKDSGWNENAFILHRHLRSKTEYLSLLSRGDTWNNSYIGLKNNREGWSSVGKKRLSIDKAFFIQHERKFQQFITQTKIQKDLIEAQNYVLARAEQTQQTVQNIQTLNRDLDRVLQGTNLEHIDRRIKYTFKRWYEKLKADSQRLRHFYTS